MRIFLAQIGPRDIIGCRHHRCQTSIGQISEVVGRALSCPPGDVCCDCCDVFLETWRRQNSVRVVDGSIIAWLLVTTNFVAKNFTLTLCRHRTAMANLPPAQPASDFTEDIDDRLVNKGRAEAVRQAFARLSHNGRNVITLCVIQELTIRQAAEALGVPLGTVKSRLSQAKQKLLPVLSDIKESTSDLGGGR